MKRFLSVLLATACLLMPAPNALRAQGLGPSSLTVAMKYNNEPLGGQRVAVCLAADAREVNGSVVFEPAAAFVGAGADFTNLTKERNIALAASLNAYAGANSVARVTKITDSGGRAVFTDLPAGLYLVTQADSEQSEYVIAPYLVSVPVMNERTRAWEYNVTAYPKTEPVKRGRVNSLSVYKVWAGAASPAGGILVQLYRDGVPYGNCVTLHAGNLWSHTWDNLSQDDTWTWTVDEFDVPEGFAKAISGGASGGFVITNTLSPNAPQKVLISGTKTWEHGSNPINLRPTSIVLQIRANGVFILQKEVGEAEHWSWSVRMDKYDKDGKEIVYTVDEAPVAGYVKAVDGYNLLNIHSTYGKPPYTLPRTDDLNNLFAWLAVMGVSAAGLAAVIIIFRRHRRREKNHT